MIRIIVKALMLLIYAISCWAAAEQIVSPVTIKRGSAILIVAINLVMAAGVVWL